MLSSGSGHPAQSPVALLPDIGHPAVVCAAQRDFGIGALGHLIEKDAGVEHLDIDAQLVHMLDPPRHVGQIAVGHRRAHVAADLGGFFVEIFFAEGEAKQAANLAVDHPVRLLIVILRLEQHGPKLFFRRRQVVPRQRTFDDMRVSVYPSHGDILRQSILDLRSDRFWILDCSPNPIPTVA